MSFFDCVLFSFVFFQVQFQTVAELESTYLSVGGAASLGCTFSISLQFDSMTVQKTPGEH